MMLKMRRMRAERIATTRPLLNPNAGVPLSKKPSTASPRPRPKFLRLPVRPLLSYWIRVDRYRPPLRTAKMEMALRSMTTIAILGFPFRQKCPSHRATLSQLSHHPFLQSLLHQSAAIRKIRTPRHRHRLLNRRHLHYLNRHRPSPRHLAKRPRLQLRHKPPSALFHHRSP